MKECMTCIQYPHVQEHILSCGVLKSCTQEGCYAYGQNQKTLLESGPPYANDDKLTFDPFEWPAKNLGFRIVHSNTYTSISSF